MFSENQSRQFYVLNLTTANVKAPDTVAVSSTAANNLSASSPDGAAKLILKDDGEGFMFYKGPLDGVQRSDVFNKCNIKSVTCCDAAALAHVKKRLEVTFKSGFSPAAGQTFILTVNIRNYLSMDYNTTLSKFGVFKATNTTASDIYKGIAINLAKQFGREPIQYIKVYLKNSSTPVEVTAKTKTTDVSSTTATGIIIEEAEQPWRLGAAPQEFVDFTVETGTVFNATTGEDVVWTDVDDASSSSYVIPNSKKLADMEWFYHKERGDVYGELGWPANIDTKLLINPDYTDGYSTLDIHYYYEGNSHNIGHSEKTITVVGTKAAIKQLIGSPASGSGSSATAATGLYAWLDGTPVSIKTVGSW